MLLFYTLNTETNHVNHAMTQIKCNVKHLNKHGADITFIFLSYGLHGSTNHCHVYICKYVGSDILCLRYSNKASTVTVPMNKQ